MSLRCSTGRPIAETELLASGGRAIETGDGPTAAARLNALRRRRPGAASAAALLARWAPGLLTLCYRSRLVKR